MIDTTIRLSLELYEIMPCIKYGCSEMPVKQILMSSDL